jgi:hypothetical protein
MQDYQQYYGTWDLQGLSYTSDDALWNQQAQDYFDLPNAAVTEQELLDSFLSACPGPEWEQALQEPPLSVMADNVNADSNASSASADCPPVDTNGSDN